MSSVFYIIPGEKGSFNIHVSRGKHRAVQVPETENRL